MSTEIVYVTIDDNEQSFLFAELDAAHMFADRMEALIIAAGYDEWEIGLGRSAPSTVNEAIEVAKGLWALDGVD